MFHRLRSLSKSRQLWGPCLAIICSFSTLVSAAPPDPEASETGADLVEQAIRLRRLGKDTEALGVLKQALDQNPTSMRVRVHLATAYQAVGDWLSAYAQLDEALQRPDDPYVARHSEILENASRTIAEHLGMLEVGGSPTGAAVLLNGQRVGVLPMAEPIRATIGSYVLEVEMTQHYPISRPVTIKRGTLTRESVQLRPIGSQSLVASGDTSALRSHGGTSETWSSAGGNGEAYAPNWVTWTLAGTSALAAGTGVVALVIRNQRASEWNDDQRCLVAAGLTREELCAAKRDSAKRAERVAIVGGASALILGAGALVSGLWKGTSSEPSARQGWLGGCVLSPEGASCRGTF